MLVLQQLSAFVSVPAKGVWQGLAMDSLKFHPGPLYLTFLSPAGGPPLKRPYSRFRGGSPARQAACGHLLPLWTPHAVRLWCQAFPRMVKPSRLFSGDIIFLEYVLAINKGRWRRKEAQAQNTVTQSLSKMGSILH
jgi:hypothetical protein